MKLWSFIVTESVDHKRLFADVRTIEKEYVHTVL